MYRSTHIPPRDRPSRGRSACEILLACTWPPGCSPGCSATKAALMRRVAGKTPEALAALVEDELRVLTENPYEYEDDDEQQFRRALPYEVAVAQQRGVLAARPHEEKVGRGGGPGWAPAAHAQDLQHCHLMHHTFLMKLHSCMAPIMQHLPQARLRYGPALLAMLDDTVATYGVDPAIGT